MKVFKFGGASVNSTERVQKVADIIRSYNGTPLLVVVSAIGKTTNGLENVVNSFWAGEKEAALGFFDEIKKDHNRRAAELGLAEGNAVYNQLRDFYTEAEWLLHDKPVREYDYYYDQLVCIGELLSTCIISHFLNSVGIHNRWTDVRDIFRTDNNFRDANINWTQTATNVAELVKPLFTETSIVVTQGFIGATDDNESTTLGREGSDYTAAVFANLLDAEAQVIWKDVEGVMSADPKAFPDAQLIAQLNYNEVIEMAYYGAQVIHPKTIKPLQNKGIPLLVKCFLNKDLPGTIINNQPVHNLPPIIVLKQHQVLFQASSKDFSFVGEQSVGQLYHLFGELNIKPNLTQNGAISFLCCLDDRAEKIEKLALAAGALFDVMIEKGLTLLTIRHYNEALIARLTEGKTVLLLQRTPDTIQLLLK
jgi:aspartate kinase